VACGALWGDDIEAGFAGGFPFALFGQVHESVGGVRGIAGEDYAAALVCVSDSLLKLAGELLVGKPFLIKGARHSIPLKHSLFI